MMISTARGSSIRVSTAVLVIPMPRADSMTDAST